MVDWELRRNPGCGRGPGAVAGCDAGRNSCGATGVSTRCARPPRALRPCRVTRRSPLRSESGCVPCDPARTGASGRRRLHAGRATSSRLAGLACADTGRSGGRKRRVSFAGQDLEPGSPPTFPLRSDSRTLRAGPPGVDRRRPRTVDWRRRQRLRQRRTRDPSAGQP